MLDDMLVVDSKKFRSRLVSDGGKFGVFLSGAVSYVNVFPCEVSLGRTEATSSSRFVPG